MNASAWDIEIAARTVWGEARDQGVSGQLAVAWAIVNRHAVGKWYSSASIAACCLYPYAFSSWNVGDPNLPQILHLPETDNGLAGCRAAVNAAINGAQVDPTGGATHYYVAGSPEPSWVTGINAQGVQVAAPALFCVQIGAHLFFKGVA